MQNYLKWRIRLNNTVLQYMYTLVEHTFNAWMVAGDPFVKMLLLQTQFYECSPIEIAVYERYIVVS